VRAPNICVVMADQHRADVLGCAGDPAAQTPHIDRLAAEGVRFSRTACQGPLCMPARASFLTERYVRDHGVYTNWAEVARDAPTYLHALRAAGYHTVAIGKHHLTQGEDDVAHVDELAGRLHERGFAEVHETGDKFSVGTRNRYTDFLAEQNLLEVYAEHLRARSYHGESESGRGATKSVPMWDATPLPIPLDAYIDAWHGEYAARWIEGYERDEPFFCFVGFPGPHDPWDAPAAATARFDLDTMPLPESTRRPDVSDMGAYGRLVRAFLRLSDTETMTDDAIRAMRRAYYADIAVIDDAVGRIVAALDARGLLDNTWIVYTSDHGEMAGEHGLMSKCVLYRPTVRVPLVVRPPGGCAPAVVDALVEHVDVPATVREIAGAPPLVESEGRSLLGHVTGAAPEPRRVTVSENWGFAAFETDRHVLVVDEDALAPVALFDRVEDPWEDENLVAAREAVPVVGELMDRIVRPFFATPAVRPHRSPFAG
jgi:arylsulfatase